MFILDKSDSFDENIIHISYDLHVLSMGERYKQYTVYHHGIGDPVCRMIGFLEAKFWYS